ncbi:hypothetical protein [Thioalkalivibrio sp. ALE11]|uniref:hypothetical protein n=1 Tax=Thioalkalivibrio sp. ALE11 TaxID=1265494 RepID=UPI00039F311C|nr:hypothetical protein [Thioalkalivibrio sp. ALE11]
MNERQAKRMKENFRRELHSGSTYEEARIRIMEDLQDIASLDEQEASAVTEQIEQELLHERYYVNKLDVPTIDAREQKRWYHGPSEYDTFWPALESHLLDTKGWTPESVQSIDDLSTSVVARLPYQST